MNNRVGQQFGHYRLVQLLGQGGVRGGLSWCAYAPADPGNRQDH